MRPLKLCIQLMEPDAIKILQCLTGGQADPEATRLFKEAVDYSRDEALQIRANWEMGIIDDYLSGEQKNG